MTNSLPKLLITGANGQMGQALINSRLSSHFNIYALNKDNADITDCNHLQKIIDKINPEIIINAAAYTKVDLAEDNISMAMKINFEAVKSLAEICQTKNIYLIHLSTDYVFDGNNNNAYLETDKTNSINIYGKSKLLGEEAIKQSLSHYIILRVSGIVSPYGHNFVKTILKLAKEKQVLTIVSDQITCPTSAFDIAETIFNIIISKLRKTGVYHFCSKEKLSWFAFAEMIVESAGLNKNVTLTPIASKDYPTQALRPQYSILNCDKIEKDFGITQPSIHESLPFIIQALHEKTT